MMSPLNIVFTKLIQGLICPYDFSNLKLPKKLVEEYSNFQE